MILDTERFFLFLSFLGTSSVLNPATAFTLSIHLAGWQGTRRILVSNNRILFFKVEKISKKMEPDWVKKDPG